VRTEKRWLIADKFVRHYAAWKIVVHMIFPRVQSPHVQLERLCRVLCLQGDRFVSVLHNVSDYICL
jgi:hypothetical protein